MSKFKLTQTATEVQNILNNSLQKPTGLSKTELVGVGVNGQENIEIGDNLTLANGKLSAATVNGLESDAEGNLTASKDLGVDGKLKLKSLVSASNPDGDITKELGGGGGGGGSQAKLYKHTITASSSNDGTVEITFYNHNNVAVDSKTKLETTIQGIGEITATGYFTRGTYVYIVFSAYFDLNSYRVYAKSCKIDIKSGNVSDAIWWLDDSFSYNDNVKEVI